MSVQPMAYQTSTRNIKTNVINKKYNYIFLISVPPSFVVVPQLQEVLLNSRLALRCTAHGIPTPNIYWKHNDNVVPCKLQCFVFMAACLIYILHTFEK